MTAPQAEVLPHLEPAPAGVPGPTRATALELDALVFPATGTSEDIATPLADDLAYPLAGHKPFPSRPDWDVKAVPA